MSKILNKPPIPTYVAATPIKKAKNSKWILIAVFAIIVIAAVVYFNKKQKENDLESA